MTFSLKRLSVLLTFSALLLFAACQPPLPPSVEPPVATFTPTARPTDTATPSPSPSPTATLTPTATATPRVSVRIITATPTATRTGPTPTATPATFTTVLTEAQVNKMAGDAIKENDTVQIDNFKVDLQPGQIVAGGRTVLGFLNVDVAIVATVPLVDGRPEPQIEEVRVNGSAVGGFIRQQAINMIQPYLDQFAGTDLGVDLDRIVITEKEVRLTGRYR